MDPFHDEPILDLEGWPDLETSASVVRCINASHTIKATEDGASIMIYTWPILNNCATHYVSRRNGVVDTISNGTATNSIIGTVMCYKYTAAQSAATNGLVLYGASPPADWDFSVPDDYFVDGPCRCLGLGVEVVDVTAEIYKQGTVTVFEVPQSIGERELIQVKAQTINGQAYAATAVESAPFNRFPGDLSQIMLYASTRQWDAKEGAYVVVPFTGRDNYPVTAENRTPYVYAGSTLNTSYVDWPNNVNTTTRMIGPYATGGTAGDPIIFTDNAFMPTHSKGIYLTGLSVNSTFTIKVKMYFESFPICSSALVTLARPSAKYDPVALALISAASKKLPVGVPYKDNPAGEWFFELIESVLPVVGIIGSAIFPEFSPMIATGTAMASSALAERKKREIADLKRKKEKMIQTERKLNRRIQEDRAVARGNGPPPAVPARDATWYREQARSKQMKRP